MPVNAKRAELARAILANEWGADFTKMFRCLARIGADKIDGVNEEQIERLRRLGLGRRDFDVLSKSEVLILTAKGKRIAAIIKEVEK